VRARRAATRTSGTRARSGRKRGGQR
jgi:hypothetical protein